MADCPVCADRFTSHLRKPIECPFCEYQACQQCQRKYLLQTTQDPHCMSCMHEWTDDLLRQQFPMSFIHGDFKRHREKCLFERERALLPDTQPLVSNYKLAKSLRSSVVEMNNRIRDLRNESNRLKRYVDEHWDTIYRAEFNGYRGTLTPREIVPGSDRHFLVRPKTVVGLWTLNPAY